jgi:hypothetical protein
LSGYFYIYQTLVYNSTNFIPSSARGSAPAATHLTNLANIYHHAKELPSVRKVRAVAGEHNQMTVVTRLRAPYFLDACILRLLVFMVYKFFLPIHVPFLLNRIFNNLVVKSTIIVGTICTRMRQKVRRARTAE